jgi:hypothetical protein
MSLPLCSSSPTEDGCEKGSKGGRRLLLVPYPRGESDPPEDVAVNDAVPKKDVKSNLAGTKGNLVC